MSKWVYSFGGEGSEGSAALRNLMGGKGANLAEMACIGLPVPPGFTITTEVCAHFTKHGCYPEGLDAQIKAAMEKVERATGARFGDPSSPLLASVRCGARAPWPGMRESFLAL